MKSVVIGVMVAAAACAMSAGAAQAGGWGKSSNNAYSSGLVNISPSVGVDLDLLNGVLNGNVVSGILSGNNTANGVLNGLGVGILSGNKSFSSKSYSVKKHH